jgi:raffinose/stachyose/melibiose transport system permease protein
MKVIVLFLLPALLIYAIFELVPIIQTVYFSFFDWNGIQGVPMKFVGFKNFISLFKYPQFIGSAKNILHLLVMSLLIQIPIAYLLAVILGSFCKGYRFFKAVFFSPLVLSVVAIGLVWYFILEPNNGVINSTLNALGLSGLAKNWLFDRETAWNTLILVRSWFRIGFVMSIFFAAITGVPEDVLEAAKIDGVNKIQNLFKILIPMTWESVKICIIVVITEGLKTFDLVYVMTEGGPNGMTETPATLMYSEAFKYDHFGRGSAIGIMILLSSVLITVVVLRIMNGKKSREVV